MPSKQSRQFNGREQGEIWQVRNLYDVLGTCSPVEESDDSQLGAYLKTAYSTYEPSHFGKLNESNFPELARLAAVCSGECLSRMKNVMSGDPSLKHVSCCHEYYVVKSSTTFKTALKRITLEMTQSG